VTAPFSAPKGRRTALSQLGGDVEVWGDAQLSEALRDAFDVVATETAELADVHGFHSYPARMHPDTAQRLIARLSTAGQTVLDPELVARIGAVAYETELTSRLLLLPASVGRARAIEGPARGDGVFITMRSLADRGRTRWVIRISYRRRSRCRFHQRAKRTSSCTLPSLLRLRIPRLAIADLPAAGC
jgi:hypothetical protein